MLRTLAVGQGALPTKQLGCVPQVVKWDTPGILQAVVISHNTENLTVNHSDAPCLEKCHVPRTLKNAAVVFDRSRSFGSATGG